MCYEVFHLSAHDQLLSGVPKFSKKGLLEIGLPKILAESWCGILKKEKCNSQLKQCKKLDHLLCGEKSAIPSNYQWPIQYHWALHWDSAKQIVDANLIDIIELSLHNLDLVWTPTGQTFSDMSQTCQWHAFKMCQTSKKNSTSTHAFFFSFCAMCLLWYKELKNA